MEKYPGAGGYFARAAGTTAMLLRSQGGMCLLRLPSKLEIEVSAQCTATVGRVSNVDHNKRIIGKAGVNRWLGIRPRSGRWHRKTGRFGRKIHPPKRVKVYSEIPAPKPQTLRYSVGGGNAVPGIYNSVRY